MSSASVTIAISGSYNGKALDSAQEDLENLAIKAASATGTAGSAIVDFGSTLADAGGTIHNFGYKLEELGETLTNCITVPLLRIAEVCSDAAIEIDDALTSVKKTVDGTEEEFDELKEAAIEFSQTSMVSASELLEIEALGAQLGYSKDELQDFAEVVTGLDIATDMDAETAAEELAQFANITGMAHDETENLASTIVALGNSTATTESSISDMAQRLAAAASNAGLSESEIMGLAAAMSSLGLNAEAGGTAMSTVMNNIDKAVALGSDSLDAYAEVAGMSAKEFATAWNEEPMEALQALITGMGTAAEESDSMAVVLSDLGITSIRQSDTFTRLANNAELLAECVETANTAWEENTALSTEVANKNDSLSAKIQILENRVTAIAEDVGTPLVNALLELVDVFEPVIETVAEAAQSFADMDEDDQQLAVSLAAVAAAAGPVLTYAGKLTQDFGDLVTSAARGIQKVGALTSELTLLAKAHKAGAESASGLVSNMEEYVKVMGTANIETPELTSLVSSLKGGLVALGVTAATALAAFAIGTIVSDFQEMQEAEENATLATEGLSEACGAVSVSAALAATSGTELGESVETVIPTIEELNEAAADLVEEFEAINEECSNDLVSLSQAETAIAKYSGQADLSASELAELESAIETLNDECGTSYEVVRDSSGAYQVMADGAAVAADEIYALIEAQKLEVQIAAQQEKLTSLYEQLADESEAYSAQLLVVQEEEAKLAEITDTSSTEYINQQAALVRAQNTLEEYADACATTESQIETVNSSINQMSEAVDGTCTAMQALTYASSSVQAYFSGNTDKVQEFADALGSAGADTTAMADLSETEWADLAAAWASSTEDMEAKLTELGISMDETAGAVYDATVSMDESVSGLPSSFQEAGYSAADSLAQAIEDGTITAEQATYFMGSTIADAAAAWPEEMSGIGTQIVEMLAQSIEDGDLSVYSATTALNYAAQDGLDGMAEYFESVGYDLPEDMAAAIEAYSSLPEDASEAMIQATVLEALNGDVSAFEDLGFEMCEGLEQGLEDNENMPTEAAGIMSEDTIQAIKDALGISSPSTVMIEIGLNMMEGLEDGISDNEGLATSAAEDVASAVEGAVDGLPSLLSSLGLSSGSGLASSLSSTASSARSAGSSVSSSAESGASSATSLLKAVGEDAGQEFASAIKSTSAKSEGTTMATTAKTGAASVSANQTGKDFITGFKNGMGSVSLYSAAVSIANSALTAIKKTLGIASPSKEAMEVGDYFGQGLIEGMDGTVSGIEAEAAVLAGAMSAEPAIPGASSGTASGASVVNNYYNVTIDSRTVEANGDAQAAIEALVSAFNLNLAMG